MIPLPLANILHHKLRSALAGLGVAIGVCMLITLAGLSRGSLDEIAQRWQAVDADLIIFPAAFGENITMASGGLLADADTQRVAELTVNGERIVRQVAPVFIHPVRIGKDEHNVVGVSAADLPMLLGGKQIAPGGQSFDRQGDLTAWMKSRLSQTTQPESDFVDIEPDLPARGGLDMVVDSRLAKVNHLKVGGKLAAAGHEFNIVGIAPEGALARAFLPLSTSEYLFTGRLGRFTLMFVKLAPGVKVNAAIDAVKQTRRLNAVAVSAYSSMLQQRFGIMYLYVDAVNAVTLVVAFLFILVTLYTMVIQRTREIAILKSMGATGATILWGVLCESMLLTAAGTLAGAAMSFGAAYAITTAKPLLTVTITWGWFGVAAAAAVVGSVVASLYPAWCALRVDVIEAINLE